MAVATLARGCQGEGRDLDTPSDGDGAAFLQSSLWKNAGESILKVPLSSRKVKGDEAKGHHGH